VTHQRAPYLTALVSAERFMKDAWSKEAVAPNPAHLSGPV
jgi:hypothetical protein